MVNNNTFVGGVAQRVWTWVNSPILGLGSVMVVFLTFLLKQHKWVLGLKTNEFFLP